MRTEPADLIGRSSVISQVREEIRFAAQSDAKVLVTGESGTGKELVAHLIHAASKRSRRPFVCINCAGVPETLLESELFGHERGSFTGAVRDKEGLFQVADQGTALLDEVGEMSPRMQGVLLRFLESGEVQRVGSSRVPGRANVRIIAATNRDLQKQIDAGTFRLDVYYRLNVIQIHVPPVRERAEDVPLLLEHFLSIYSSRYEQPRRVLTAPALAALAAYPWPGNVRQLKNIVERMALRGPRPIEVSHLPPEVIEQRMTQTYRPNATATTADELYARMVTGESFWSVVYEPFMARDLTRQDVREVVRLGLRATQGRYKLLLQLFNMRPDDYKPLLNLLRAHGCHLPFQEFRTIEPETRQARERPDAAA
jgi:transcriptional regulator with PAS, ATPase and Fis domain